MGVLGLQFPLDQGAGPVPTEADLPAGRQAFQRIRLTRRPNLSVPECVEGAVIIRIHPLSTAPV